MVRDTVSHLRAEGQQVFLDAEHFFDGYRANRDYALEVLRTAYEAGADVDRAVRHQRRDAARLGLRRGPRRRRRPPASGSASTRTTTAAARSRTRWPRSTPAPPTCRAASTATASAPATPTWSRSSPTSSSSSTGQVLPPGLLRGLDPDRARRRRGHQLPAGLAAAVRRRLGVRAQGRPARERDQGRPGPLPAHAAGAGRQRHAAARLRHGRAGLDRAQGPRARLRPLRRPGAGHRGDRPGQGARVARVTRSRPPTRRSSCCSPRWSRACGRRTSRSSRGG